MKVVEALEYECISSKSYFDHLPLNLWYKIQRFTQSLNMGISLKTVLRSIYEKLHYLLTCDWI